MDKIITISACGMNKRQVLAIGRQMENNYRQIIFDCSGFGVEVSSVTLVHQRSLDMAPYIVETSSTDQLTWTITNTDTAYPGYGKAELRITFTNGLAKSVVFTTMVIQSITADTTIPQPLQSWYDAMIDYIDEHSISPEELGQAIEDYLEEHPIQAPVQSVNGETGDVVITAADLGALTSELDPVFGASAAAGITSANITAWNGKYTKPSGGVPVSDLNSTAQSRLMPTGGTTGQVLAKKSNSNYDTEWVNQSGGGGAVDSVNGKTGTVVLDASDVGALPDTTTASDLGAYVKPTGGIPKEDLASAVQTSLGKADTALQAAPVTSVNGQTGAVTVSVPTKTSDLTNDSGFITSAPVASVDGKTGAVTVIPTGGSAGQVLAKASATDRDVEWITPSGGGGGETVDASNVKLASGTVPAGITSPTVGDGLVDTGLTLGDLKAYKYFYFKIRLDDNKPYLGFRIGNTNFQITNSNGISIQFTWLDSAKTALLPMHYNSGNSGISGKPLLEANIAYYVFGTLNAKEILGSLPIPTDNTSKVYLGITNMNGLPATTKDLIWGIFGMGEYQ